MGHHRTVAPPTNGQHPHPSSSPPREWQQRVWRGLCLPGYTYLGISHLSPSSPLPAPSPTCCLAPRFWGSTLDQDSLPWFSSCLLWFCVMGRGAARSAQGGQGGELCKKGLARSSAAPMALWHEVTMLGGSPAGTEQGPRSGPLLQLSTGGNCSQLLSCRLWLFHAYKIPGQQDLHVDRFYVIEIHIVGCKCCVIIIRAGQHRDVGWWWPEGSVAQTFTGDPGSETPLPRQFLRRRVAPFISSDAVSNDTAQRW